MAQLFKARPGHTLQDALFFFKKMSGLKKIKKRFVVITTFLITYSKVIKSLGKIRVDSQSLLKRQDRLINVQDAFRVNDASKIKDKTVLLVDDVLTTGTTLNECSKMLKQAGAKKIVVAVVASGRRFQ